MLAGAYVAPQAWWVELLCSEPIRPGRPRTKSDKDLWGALDPENEFWVWECMIGCPGDPEYDAAVHAQQLARRRFLYRQKKRRERATLVGE